MKEIPSSRHAYFKHSYVNLVPENEAELLNLLGRSKKPPKTYEEALKANLKEWEEAAAKRWDLLQENLAERNDRWACHILMENYLYACEMVMSYQKALGVEHDARKVD